MFYCRDCKKYHKDAEKVKVKKYRITCSSCSEKLTKAKVKNNDSANQRK